MSVAVMWEAKAADGQAAALLAWARAQCLDAAPLRRETFTATGGRVLVITWWDPETQGGSGPPELPEPDPTLVARPVHRWRFTSLGTDV